ncbi:hypothetical protein ACWEQ8_27660 [Streptomyces noursei]
MTVLTVRSRRRTWFLALVLALVGYLLVGPQTGAARADDCDKLPDNVKGYCQRDPAPGTGKDQPDPCRGLTGPAKDDCREQNGKSAPPPSKVPTPCDLLSGKVKELCESRSKGTPDLGGLTPGCRTAPTPALPDRGPAAWAATPPRTAPAPVDPTKPQAQAHLWEQYGVSGLEWHTYDLQCQGVTGMVSAAGTEYETKIANTILNMSKWWTTLAISLQNEATGDGFLAKLNDVFGTATQAVAKAVYQPWIVISLLVLGLGIVYRARSRNLPDVVKGLAWAMLVMTITSLAFNYPQEAGKLADTALTQTVGRIQQGVAGDTEHGADAATSQGNLLTSAILYRSWAEGNFGSADSQTAKQYGVQLLDAQSLTWAEARLPADERATIMQAKSKRWEEIASQIKDSDPEAYKYLTGEADGRMGAAMSSVIGSVPSNWYSVVSSNVIICARLILKMVIVFLPAIAPIALHKRFSGTLQTLLKSGAAAIINAPLFVLAAAVDTLLIKVLLASDNGISGWFAFVLIWIITAMLWAISRPFRRLNSMVSPNSDWFGSGTGILGKAKAAAAGGVIGYAKGKMSARQIGRMVNVGRGGSAAAGAGGGAAEDAEETLVERSVRYPGETEWTEERPYQPSPAAPPQDQGYWAPTRGEEGDVPWVSEPQESAGDETPQQPTYVPQTGPTAGSGGEPPEAAEAGTTMTAEPWTAPSSTLVPDDHALIGAAAPAGTLPPAGPRGPVPPQGGAPRAESEPQASTGSVGEDRPEPRMAPSVTESDGSTTFVIYSPTEGYTTAHTPGGGAEEGNPDA